MRAEIIAIGTELTSGQKLDTNSQWLSLELAELGIPVDWHTTVADDLELNVAALRIAASRADLVLITGGLGPTLDDLTRDALAQLAGVELVLHEPSLEFIESFFRQRGREMPARNRVQAMFPAGSEPLPNPIGTAPGIWMEISRGAASSVCRIGAMPGVPAEMHRMFHEQVRPRLQGSGKVIRRAVLNCFGLGESHVEQLLGELTARKRNPEIGITASEATISLRIIATGETEAECAAQIEEARSEIRRRLGHHVFSEGDTSLQEVVLEMLTERQATLATIEAGTRGLLANWLSMADRSQRYVGGTVVSAARGTQALSSQSDDPYGADVARQMAEHCRADFGSDYALAVGWFPPVDTGSIAHAAPSAWIALTSPSGTVSEQLSLWGSPAILHSQVAKASLNLLRLHLLKVAGRASL